MPPWTAVQMVRLAPSGTIPMIRLQERSLDMMAAGTPVSKRHEALERQQNSIADGKGRIANDAAFSIYV
jgi:hypothetical protein